MWNSSLRRFGLPLHLLGASFGSQKAIVGPTTGSSRPAHRPLAELEGGDVSQERAPHPRHICLVRHPGSFDARIGSHEENIGGHGQNLLRIPMVWKEICKGRQLCMV